MNLYFDFKYFFNSTNSDATETNFIQFKHIGKQESNGLKIRAPASKECEQHQPSHNTLTQDGLKFKNPKSLPLLNIQKNIFMQNFECLVVKNFMQNKTWCAQRTYNSWLI